MIEGLMNKFFELKAFESKVLKVTIGKIEVMLSGNIAMDGLSKSKVEACGVCGLRVKANSVLYVQCGKWIHGRCAGVRRVTPRISRNVAYRRCIGNIGEAVEQEEKLCDEVETLREFTYLGDRVNAGGGCESAVTSRTRCWWVKFRECSELLYGKRFPLGLKGVFNKSYVRPAVLYGSKACCLKEFRLGIFSRTKRYMARAMCEVQLTDFKHWSL